MKIQSIQIALFFKDLLIERPDLKFRTLIDNFNDVFDTMPTQFELPPGTPNDVPYLILRSKNNLTNCNVSRSRIDFISEDLDYVENQDKLLSYINEVTNVIEIINFGFITTHFEKNENASSNIVKKYFKNTIADLKEVSLRFNTLIKLNRETYNCNIAISDIKQQNVHTKVVRKGLLVQKDINSINLNVKNEVYTGTKIQSLFKSAHQNLYSSNVDV